MLPRPYILEYMHGLQFNGSFPWQVLVLLGDTLLEQLLLRVSAVEVDMLLDKTSIGLTY